MFSHTKKDINLNTAYVLNDCEFTISPIIDFKAVEVIGNKFNNTN